MARPAEYDLDNVLDKAMEIFWEKGFSGVCMAELVDYTGLNRKTMYSLFKNKEGLFRDALEHYYVKLAAKKSAVLEKYPGKKGIEMFLKTFKFHKNFKGCLFSNSISEKEFLQQETFNITKEYFIKMRKAIEKKLEQAVSRGEFSGDPKAMALTIITILHGFHVFGKYNHSQDDSDAIFNNVLEMIK